MALVKCKECKEKVSTKAKTCPNCGAKPPKKTSTFTWAVLIIILAVVFSPMYLPKAPPLSPEQQAAKAEERKIKNAIDAKEAAEEARLDALKEHKWRVIAGGKNAVRTKLKDPDAAQFRDVSFVQKPNQSGFACGEVNSKNSFGAYTGYQYFLSSGAVKTTYLQNEVDDFSKLWNKYCAG